MAITHAIPADRAGLSIPISDDGVHDLVCSLVLLFITYAHHWVKASLSISLVMIKRRH